VLANLYILFPAFGIPDGSKYIVPFTVPFNLIKGAALTLITFLIYKPLSPILHGLRR
jgi:riboflavin transporter FmnP